MSRSAPDPKVLRARLLNWYDAHRRTLPWRAGPGARPDPYAVWLSEIMLQQTTVATVGPYFVDFMARWPTVADLARADLDEVLVAWQGLGYYARARNLHRCAGVVADAHGGRFPATEAGLAALPGVGPYTAAAIAAIAFDRPVVPVDGNVERVMARLYDIRTPLPASKRGINDRARDWAAAERPGDLAQALMDLGATVCTPRAPACAICPIAEGCLARAAGDPESLPVKAPKRTRPERRAVIFWLRDGDGRVLLRRRPESGLLGAMMEFPSTPWREGDWPDDAEIAAAQPAPVRWRRVPGEAVHVFTHFRLTLRVLSGHVAARRRPRGVWTAPADFAGQALPTAMKKVVRLVETHSLETAPRDEN